MEIKPIRLEADYEEALTAMSRLMSAEVGMVEHDYLDVTTTLIEAYEARNFAIAAGPRISPPALSTE